MNLGITYKEREANILDMMKTKPFESLMAVFAEFYGKEYALHPQFEAAVRQRAVANKHVDDGVKASCQLWLTEKGREKAEKLLDV